MVVKLPVMSEQEVRLLIQEQALCRIAFKGSTHPYIAPFQYVWLDGALYFHFTDYGRKMQLLEADNRVCVEIEQFQPDLSEYKFVSIRGDLHVVDDPHERSAVIRMMAEHGRQRLSPNFLAAHGVQTGAGWSALTPDEPLVIVKLDSVEAVGVKSP